MELSGTHQFDVSAERLWEALQDPHVLQATLPGCERLEAVDDHTWKATVSAGVGAIRGTYQGTVELHDLQPPHAWRMRVSGAGAPGTVDADVAIQLAELTADRTQLSWDANAIVGGMIGGVGQRMLSAVSRRMADQFFVAVAQVLAGSAAASGQHAARHAGDDPAGGGSAGGGSHEQPDLARPASAGLGAASSVRASSGGLGGDASEARMMAATIAGGVLALAGVLIGRRLSKPDRHERR